MDGVLSGGIAASHFLLGMVDNWKDHDFYACGACNLGGEEI